KRVHAAESPCGRTSNPELTAKTCGGRPHSPVAAIPHCAATATCGARAVTAGGVGGAGAGGGSRRGPSAVQRPVAPRMAHSGPLIRTLGDPHDENGRGPALTSRQGGQ